VDELPGLMEQLEKDAEASLANAEKILGLRESQPENAEPVVEEDAVQDEDGLGV